MTAPTTLVVGFPVRYVKRELMRAQNLTISIPYKGCDKNCPYCVSRMTGNVNNTDSGLNMMRNIPKVITLAKAAQITSVLLTGKGEPFLNFKDVLAFTKAFSEFPVEIQTNGKWLSNHTFNETPEPGYIKENSCPSHKQESCLSDLFLAGMNVISISIDNTNDIPRFKEVVKELHKTGMLVRVTFNITEKLSLSCDHGKVPLTFINLVKQCKIWGVDQMTLRNICIPNNTEETSQTLWIKENVKPETYNRLRGEMKESCESKGFLVRNLPYGAKVYDFMGVSISFSDYCIQDSNDGDDIRSLIYLEDGGLYTSWNSKASRLF